MYAGGRELSIEGQKNTIWTPGSAQDTHRTRESDPRHGERCRPRWQGACGRCTAGCQGATERRGAVAQTAAYAGGAVVRR